MLFNGQIQLRDSLLGGNILTTPFIDDNFTNLLSNDATGVKDIDLPPIFFLLLGSKQALSNN